MPPLGNGGEGGSSGTGVPRGQGVTPRLGYGGVQALGSSLAWAMSAPQLGFGVQGGPQLGCGVQGGPRYTRVPIGLGCRGSSGSVCGAPPDACAPLPPSPPLPPAGAAARGPAPPWAAAGAGGPGQHPAHPGGGPPWPGHPPTRQRAQPPPQGGDQAEGGCGGAGAPTQSRWVTVPPVRVSLAPPQSSSPPPRTRASPSCLMAPCALWGCPPPRRRRTGDPPPWPRYLGPPGIQRAGPPPTPSPSACSCLRLSGQHGQLCPPRTSSAPLSESAGGNPSPLPVQAPSQDQSPQ